MKRRSNFFISLLQLLNLEMDDMRIWMAVYPAFKIEKIHMQSRMPILSKRLLKNSRMRLQKCHTLIELPMIFQSNSILYAGWIQFIFWLKQHSISFYEAALLRNRNNESQISIIMGKTKRLMIFILMLEKVACTIMNNDTLIKNSTAPNNLEFYRTDITLRSKEYPERRFYFCSFTFNSDCLIIPVPTQEYVQMNKSNMFQSTSHKISITIARWQKGEYYRVLSCLSQRGGPKFSLASINLSIAPLIRISPNRPIMTILKLTRGRDSTFLACLRQYEITMISTAIDSTLFKSVLQIQQIQFIKPLMIHYIIYHISKKICQSNHQ